MPCGGWSLGFQPSHCGEQKSKSGAAKMRCLRDDHHHQAGTVKSHNSQSPSSSLRGHAKNLTSTVSTRGVSWELVTLHGFVALKPVLDPRPKLGSICLVQPPAPKHQIKRPGEGRERRFITRLRTQRGRTQRRHSAHL
jgi:hypothetical protein